MAKEGHVELGRIILLLIVMIMLSLVIYPASFSQENQEVALRNRVLTAENTVSLRQVRDNYYIIEVPQPVTEETYKMIQQKLIIEGVIPPNYYIVKGNQKRFKQLRDAGVLTRIWVYTNENNIDNNIDKTLEEEQTTTVRVILFESAKKEELLQQLIVYGAIKYVFDNDIVLETQGQNVKEIAKIKGVEWVEREVQPVVFNDVAVVITGASAERQDFNIYGNGESIAVSDTGLDRGVNDGTMHNDFQGRILNLIDVANCCSTGPDDDNGHGTHVAGTALGNGILSGSNPGIKQYSGSYAGAAPEAQLIFQAIGDDSGSNGLHPPALISGLFQPAYNQGARVHSNSWGVNSPSLFGSYSAVSRDIDKFILDNKDMNIIFAVGNYANQGGVWSNDTIATHAAAKNVIGVGGSENYKPLIADPPILADNINELYLGSGRGPTDDGRIKPDIIAPATEIFSTRSRVAVQTGLCIKNQSNQGGNYNLGPNYSTCSGTSMATPHIAGLVALLREFYKTHVGSTNPSSALIKASLINSAMDMGYGLPSNMTGWGRVNISRVLPSPSNELFVQEITPGLITGQGNVCQLLFVDSGAPFKATLVWSDKEAAIAAQKTLINNLNLLVRDPVGNTYYGNDFLPPYDNIADDTNNVEQVIIPNPIAGEYTFSVTAANVPVPPQPYAIVVSYKQQTLPPGPQVYSHICTTS